MTKRARVTPAQLTMFTALGLPERLEKDMTGRELVGRFLLLGGGVQSGTLVEMIVEGVIPRVDAVIFADTGDEPHWVWRMIPHYRQRLNSVDIPLRITKRPDDSGYCGALRSISRDFLEVNKGWVKSQVFNTLPLYVKNPVTGKRGMLRRQCTDRFKISPTNNSIKAFLHHTGKVDLLEIENGWVTTMRKVPRNVYVECLFGISTDEDERADTQRGAGWQKPVYPLMEMEMSRDDCVKWLQDHNLPVPEKSACYFCPFRNNDSWLWMKNTYPDVFEDACKFDDMLRQLHTQGKLNIRGIPYLHESLTPLRDIDFGRVGWAGKSDGFKKEAARSSGSCRGRGAFTCHG
jgi:hypothetical protein